MALSLGPGEFVNDPSELHSFPFSFVCALFSAKLHAVSLSLALTLGALSRSVWLVYKTFRRRTVILDGSFGGFSFRGLSKGVFSFVDSKLECGMLGADAFR